MFPSSKSLCSALRNSFAAIFPAAHRDRKFRRQRTCGTEQLEVRQLLTGDFELGYSVGGTLEDSVDGITVDSTGYVYTVGSFQNMVDLNPGATTVTATSAGGNDVLVTKTNSLGTLI